MFSIYLSYFEGQMQPPLPPLNAPLDAEDFLYMQLNALSSQMQTPKQKLNILQNIYREFLA